MSAIPRLAAADRRGIAPGLARQLGTDGQAEAQVGGIAREGKRIGGLEHAPGFGVAPSHASLVRPEAADLGEAVGARASCRQCLGPDDQVAHGLGVTQLAVASGELNQDGSLGAGIGADGVLHQAATGVQHLAHRDRPITDLGEQQILKLDLGVSAPALADGRVSLEAGLAHLALPRRRWRREDRPPPAARSPRRPRCGG